MKLDILNEIDPVRLGEELTEARKRRGLTQQQAADTIQVLRTTMVAIEQGKRRIRADELIKLAELYKCHVSDLVRPRPKVDPTMPQYRSDNLLDAEDQAAADQHVSQLVEYARQYYELEQLLNRPLPYKYPPEYARGGDVGLAAETAASMERNRLGLGDGPIGDLRAVLEHEVGIRIFYFPLPKKFSAIYVYDDKLGACIAVNQNHPEERRRLSEAHDYGHVIDNRRLSDVYIEHRNRYASPAEQFADNFMLYFLMPTTSVRRRCNEILSQRKFTAGDIVTLAAYYGVSAETMARRLEELQILRAGSWQTLKEKGFKVREVQQQLGIVTPVARDSKFPVRYQLLAVEALDAGLITESEFADLLQLDLVHARHLAQLLQSQVQEVSRESLDPENGSGQLREGNFEQ
ncbi:MAG: transcriptional regulator [Chloroflexi bacterium]|nr:MAG: transcriptional regulator [Chloroflexota bacterium]